MQFLETIEHADNGVSETAGHLFHDLMMAYEGTTLAKRVNFRYAHWLKDVAPWEAIPSLQTAIHDFPVLRDYLSFWLGQAYAQAGFPQEAADAFLRVSEEFPHSLLRSEALYAAGELYVSLDKCESAISVLSQASQLDAKHPKVVTALFQMGECADRLGHREQAIEIFREMWRTYPSAQETEQAERWLQQELGTLFLPSLKEQHDRAMAWYKAGELEKAIPLFQQYLTVSSPTPEWFQVKYTLAMAFVRLKQYDHAQRTLTELADSKFNKKGDVLVWLGRVFLRQGQGPQLAALLRSSSQEPITGDEQSLLQVFYGIWLEDHGKWQEALDAYRQAALVASSSTQRIDTLWRVGWMLYQQNKFEEAIDVFQKLIAAVGIPTTESALHSSLQAHYWSARSQEHLGQMERSRESFANLTKEYPFTYYGQLAEGRLGTMDVSPKQWTVLTSTETMPAVPEDLQQDPHYQKIQELKNLRLFAYAIRELEGVMKTHGKDPQSFHFLIALASDIGAYDAGIRLAIRHFGGLLRKGQLPLSSPVWMGAFPMGYQDLIRSSVPAHVDPYLVAGLIREESLYSARVVSPVGAIGLMQLMPATARKVSGDLGLPTTTNLPQGLFEPRHNIHLGTHYLGQLLHLFQNNLVYSVAAYNAGPQAVNRWINQNGQREPDEFVELIGYRETRGYVKRVLGSYRIYRMLFSEPCRSVSLDRFC